MIETALNDVLMSFDNFLIATDVNETEFHCLGFFGAKFIVTCLEICFKASVFAPRDCERKVVQGSMTSVKRI